MGNRTRGGALALAWAVAPLAGCTQAPALPPGGPSAEAVRVAREVVVKMSGDQQAILRASTGSLTTLLQRDGTLPPERARVLVQEVVVPVVLRNIDGLTLLRARDLAAALSIEDLRAVSAFYDTPAGRNLTRAQPQVTEAFVASLSQWTAALRPELFAKLIEVYKARGWSLRAPMAPNVPAAPGTRT